MRWFPSRSAIGRLLRLAQKEQREILRDRRTITTLILMPLLLYPLISLGFQQFFFSAVRGLAAPRPVLGFESEQQGQQWMAILTAAGAKFVPPGTPPRKIAVGEQQQFEWQVTVATDLKTAVRRLDCDIGLRTLNGQPFVLVPRQDIALDAEIFTHPSDRLSEQAATELEKLLQQASQILLQRRLTRLQITQRADPIRPVRAPVISGPTTRQGLLPASLIPLILILMTMTGAVYPAIDLTAGERERGTLEVLMAAPIPRNLVLLAKYLAVVLVAVLTASANLLAMVATLIASGLTSFVLGDVGLSPLTLTVIFALLVLFASFFSALLLVLTSISRSFKEAQAYLVPLMLASLAPGLASLAPNLELSGLMTITPLVNIVLLARDVLLNKAQIVPALLTVVSTLLYAAGAITVAARLFGSEAVLYSQHGSWRDMLRRHRLATPEPRFGSAVLTLIWLVPGLFFSNSLLAQAQHWPLPARLLIGGLASGLIFAGLPLCMAWHQRNSISESFATKPVRPRWLLVIAMLLGISLWPLAHEIVVFQHQTGLIPLDDTRLTQADTLIAQLRAQPLWLLLVCLAIVPACSEELFFRGYFYAAVRRHRSPGSTIVWTAVLFGLFHVVVTDSFAVERLIPSLSLGLVLGWVRDRSGSIFPGMLLHACHNGLLMVLLKHQAWLQARGWDWKDAEHLPTGWLLVSAVVLLLGTAIFHRFRRRPSSNTGDVPPPTAGESETVTPS